MKQTNNAGPRSEYHFHDAERIRFVIGASGFNPDLFARWLGLRSGTRICRVLLGQARISADLARLIHARFPQIDLEWLKTGRVGGLRAPERADGASLTDGEAPDERRE